MEHNYESMTTHIRLHSEQKIITIWYKMLHATLLEVWELEGFKQQK